MIKFPPTKQKTVILPKGETIVLKADDANYDRGLVVKLAGKGGYDMAYWYDKPNKIYPAEIKIDGKSITKDGKIVHIGYHPELSSYKSKSNPSKHSKFAMYAITGTVGGKILFNKPLVGFFIGTLIGMYSDQPSD